MWSIKSQCFFKILLLLINSKRAIEKCAMPTLELWRGGLSTKAIRIIEGA